jgi:hypothetical protein
MAEVFEKNNSDLVGIHLKNNTQEYKDDTIKEVNQLQTVLKNSGVAVDERLLN